MGLKDDIYKAYEKTMITPDNPPDDEQLKKIETLAEDMTSAVIDFLTKQTFTITQLKAELEVEEIKTQAPLNADVLSSVMVNVNPGQVVATPVGPGTTTSPGLGTVSQGKAGVLIPKINLTKSGGQGGLLRAKGHAYIGRNPIPGGKTNEDKTKVVLLEENIKDR